MTLTEIYPRPTVKTVIFQIRFPNLFYMESKIGELQIQVMERFPESSLLFRRQVLLADVGPEVREEDLPKLDERLGAKVWQFISPNKYKLNVQSNSLDITSEFHKTYDSQASADRFRDIIEFVLERFFVVSQRSDRHPCWLAICRRVSPLASQRQ